MEKINIKINGQVVQADPDSTILEVVRKYNLDKIPTLCHSDELEPYASCFVCVVEVKGKKNLVPSCATKVMPGMEVETNNERVISARKMALELLLSNHYANCVSPCMEGCPAEVDVQGYIALSAIGEYVQAVDLIREKNPLPAICGRVCVRKCEVVCRRQEIDQPVAINWIKRYLTDQPGIYDTPPKREPDTGKKIAIVGSGPAGLTAAWFLGKKGHKPIIFEAQPKSGGMLRYGIPEYRLPDDVLDAEVDYILKAGVEIKYNIKIGKDITLDDLRKKYDAVFIATGAHQGNPMRVEGEDDTEGIIRGAEFLRKQYNNREPLSGTVVVIGGGNTAMDVARTSWRLGADKVIILYRRTRAEMPADEMEIIDCLEEGIEIMELAAPISIVKENGKLKALRCIRMKLGEPDQSGRRRPIPLEGSEFELPCQLAVPAIGQSTELDGLLEIDDKEIQVTKWNTFVINPETMETNIKGVFAGGDAADDGPTVVIDAIRDGQKAAKGIHAFLTGTPLPKKEFRVMKEFWKKPGKTELGDVKESPRHEIHNLDVEQRRLNFKEVALGFDYEDNVHECNRCLSCGCVSYFECDLRRYAEQYNVDMNEFKGYVRKHKVDSRHPYIEYDPNKCILCARCIRTCAKVLPIAALGLVNRGFKAEMRPAMNDPLIETSCVSCGNCVDSCPTGALTIKYPFPGKAALKTIDVKSHCAFCSLACEITVKKISDKHYYISSSGTPGDYLCRYGRFGVEVFYKRQRITKPILQSNFGKQTINIDDAINKATTELKNIANQFGPEKVAVFVSPYLTNEELYLASKIAREGLGTNNIGSLSVLATGQDSGALDKAFGFTGSTNDRSCIKKADLIICNNTSIESDHLVLSAEVIAAVRAGTKFMVINSALDNTDKTLASLTLDPLRGTTTILWQGILQLLLKNDSHAVVNIDDLTDKNFNIEEISQLTGVDLDIIKKAAHIIASAKNVVVIHSPDRPQDRARGDIEMLANLTVLLRKMKKEADLLLPQKFSNAMGLEIMGADPYFAPGRRIIDASVQGASSRSALYEMLKNGELKASFIIGENPLGWNKTETWFKNIEFLVAMDWASSETTSMANIVLPGSTYLESSGTRCNFEGKLIKFNKTISSSVGKIGREILADFAKALNVKVSADISTEIQRIVEDNLDKSLKPFCWNVGESKAALPKEEFIKVNISLEPGMIPPPLTQYEAYKHEIINVGKTYYRAKHK